MAFKSFEGVSDAARAVQDYLMDHGSDVPEELRDKLRALVGPTTSPVDTVVRGAELIYARRKDEDIPNALKKLGAGLSLVAQQYNFHGMAENDRGTKIALSFMRDANVENPIATDYPVEADDPEVKDEFKPAEPEPEPDAPAQAARHRTPTSRVTDITVRDGEEPPATEGARRPRSRKRTQK